MSSGRLVVEGHGSCGLAIGQSLLDACEAAGVPMESDCGGCAACSACRVAVVDGGQYLSPQGTEEGPFLDEEGQRLGCQALRTSGGVVVVRLEPGW